MKKMSMIVSALLLAAGCTAAPQPAAPASTSAAEPSSQAASEAAAPMGEKITVTVFAAASLKETLTEISNVYTAQNQNVELVFNFDSSGTLKTQIEEGAPCDLFISAAPKQMNALDASKEGGADFILSDSRVDLLENKVVLAVPEGNPKGITSYEQLAKALKDGSAMLAMGNSDVPVGQYTQKIFSFFRLDEAAIAQAGNITYGTNVKEVTAQVSEAAVDCGIIYATDAYSAGLTVAATATPEMCGQVIYPAAVLKNAPRQQQAKDVLSFLQGQAAGEIFQKVGFTPLS